MIILVPLPLLEASQIPLKRRGFAKCETSRKLRDFVCRNMNTDLIARHHALSFCCWVTVLVHRSLESIAETSGLSKLALRDFMKTEMMKPQSCALRSPPACCVAFGTAPDAAGAVRHFAEAAKHTVPEAMLCLAERLINAAWAATRTDAERFQFVASDDNSFNCPSCIIDEWVMPSYPLKGAQGVTNYICYDFAFDVANKTKAVGGHGAGRRLAGSCAPSRHRPSLRWAPQGKFGGAR